jgi:hypothetical protein
MEMRIERWDGMRLDAGDAVLRLQRHGFMTTRTDDFTWHVEKWLRSSAEIGRARGRRMSRLDGTGLLYGGAFIHYGESVTSTKRWWNYCSGL